MFCHSSDRVMSATLREAAIVSDMLRAATVIRSERHLGLGGVRVRPAAVFGGQRGNAALDGKASITSDKGWDLNGMTVVSDAPWTKILPIFDAKGENPMGIGLQNRLSGGKDSGVIALLTTEYSGSDSLWTLSPSVNGEDTSGRPRKIPIST